MLRRLAVLSLISLVYGCGGAEKKPVNLLPSDSAREATALKRRGCGEGRERLVDVNDDGYANVRHVSDGNRPVCTEIDLNLDGRVDVTRVFDAAGQTSFEQFDLDFDGRLDQHSFYEGGKLLRKELDTNFDRMVDTWVWCSGPYLARMERDRHRRGRVDTWEDYERGLLSGVAYDDNADGKAERWEKYRLGRLTEVMLDMNKDGKPDHSEQPTSGFEGAAPEPVSCDGELVPAASPEQRQASAPPPPPTPPSEPAADGAAAPAPDAPAADAGVQP
jgi:hypothetical protein